jgi:NCAIR mutase (PurE)-related protein
MDRTEIEKYAQRMLAGELSLDGFVDQIAQQPTVEIDGANLDIDRARRCGFPEVVYGHGKSSDTLARIFETLIDQGVDVFATRISPEKADALAGRFPGQRYNEVARTVRIPLAASQEHNSSGMVAIVTAGSSDLAVAEEAHETLDWMNVGHKLFVDVGVAGPQRLLSHVDNLRAADALVVIAGMEGALPSVVGGHVAVPVIAVPTSVGYGANFGGVAALLSMLNSCAANVTVVNIDAGFKGAYIAGLIARQTHARQE